MVLQDYQKQIELTGILKGSSTTPVYVPLDTNNALVY